MRETPSSWSHSKKAAGAAVASGGLTLPQFCPGPAPGTLHRGGITQAQPQPGSPLLCGSLATTPGHSSAPCTAGLTLPPSVMAPGMSPHTSGEALAGLSEGPLLPRLQGVLAGFPHGPSGPQSPLQL